MSGETHLYLGRQFRLKLIPCEGREEVKLIRGYFQVYLHDTTDHARVERLLTRWLDAHGRTIITARLTRCHAELQRYGVPTPTSITFRRMEKRWGSCTKAGGVLFNTELAHVPVPCIDYVVAHELCHLKHPEPQPSLLRLTHPGDAGLAAAEGTVGDGDTVNGCRRELMSTSRVFSVAEFLRAYPLRAGNMMWLLGAGASATAGVPTAYHMIWEFKRAIYCSDHRLPIKVCEDLSDQTLRNRLQAYFDGKGSFPACDSAEEYAYYFEAAYPSDADRRRYIDEKIKEASPSFGHKVLATLMGIGKANVAWTTNFDRLIEDAYSMMHGSNSRLIAVNLENLGWLTKL